VLTTLGLWTFVAEPATLGVLGATLALAWPVGRRLADRIPCRRPVAVALVVAVGVVLALTLTPNRPVNSLEPLPPPHFLSLLRHRPGALWTQLTTPPRDLEQLANIALYVPVGLLAWLAWRRVLRASVGGLLLTVAVETCQYGIIGRAGSITDIRNNTLGAILGAVFTAAATARYAATRTVREAGHDQ
jgi:glycopeptide antibiotics resistance protein